MERRREACGMANFCINCGAPLEDGAKFCTNCGASREGDKISSLNGKQNSLDPKIRRMQIDRPLNNQGAGSNKNIMIGVLIGLLIILGAGCGYYYYTAQQSALEIATKTAAEKAAHIYTFKSASRPIKSLYLSIIGCASLAINSSV